MKRGRAIDEERVIVFGDGQFRNLHFIFCCPCCVPSAPDFQEEAVAVKIQALGDCRRLTVITPCVVSILFISFKANARPNRRVTRRGSAVRLRPLLDDFPDRVVSAKRTELQACSRRT